jgi:hypothetical protein
VSAIADLPSAYLRLSLQCLEFSVVATTEPAPSIPTPFVSETVDLSIPYDAAMLLAYDKAVSELRQLCDVDDEECITPIRFWNLEVGRRKVAVAAGISQTSSL